MTTSASKQQLKAAALPAPIKLNKGIVKKVSCGDSVINISGQPCEDPATEKQNNISCGIASKFASRVLNNEPIIGILCVEFPDKINGNGKSYIAASYVKFLESAGSRVVPIRIGQTKEYYENIMSKINGVLLPGGDAPFDKLNGFSEAGRRIYRIAMELNDRGVYMPLWGTCFGFEFFAYVSSGGKLVLSNCLAEGISLSLKFQPDYRNSKLFGKKISQDIIKILSTQNVTANFHHFCVTMKDLKDYQLESSWKVLSTSEDLIGLEFISSMEHKKYPFFGVQFHPEKNCFEWIRGRNISHTENAIKSAQYFANFFINQCRKNNQHFDGNNENLSLIHNYPITYTGKTSTYFHKFEQCYFFDRNICKIE